MRYWRFYPDKLPVFLTAVIVELIRYRQSLQVVGQEQNQDVLPLIQTGLVTVPNRVWLF
ncbi:hypothetical protein PL9631_490043 [Planktothrix paucivesiculata PCC 9631]|uniref:Uncharacterized protein n=1 Tax=Planktothrix paucivesiculata PCC 9631 TaxID=671071 RepID=A0A7Z9BQ61_9CYAN|nr:hypothetical protein PL9631_490043 [Planktothrix paucivesiculata PCC 9631]